LFERYTELARRILFFARYETSQLGHRSITPEHLLLGLIREGKGLDSRIFSRAGLNPDAFRREIEARLVFEEKIPTSVEIPFSDAAKRVLQFAAMEADRLLHNYIGPEHLLLGLLHERSTIAAELLNVHGLRLDDVRQQIVILFNEQSSPIGAMGLASHPVTPHRDRDTARFFASAITLKSLLAHVLNVDANRLEVPPDLDRRLLSLARERRTVDVYVLAGVPGQIMRSDESVCASGGVGGGSFAFTTTSALSFQAVPDPTAGPSLHSLGPLSMHGTTMAEFARMIEGVVNHPVIDESGLDGRYDIEVSGPHNSVDAFIAALQREAGLTLTRATREIEMIVVGGN